MGVSNATQKKPSREALDMRNLIGGISGALLGSFILSHVLTLSNPGYPQAFTLIWPLLVGSSALLSTAQHLFDFSIIGWYILVWLLIGVISGAFSISKWNVVRTIIWVGVIVAITALASLLLLNPSFWDSARRNVYLVILFARSILTSLISLISGIPMVTLLLRLRRETEAPLPQKIETVCDCGAVYKSRPLICAECGKTLRKHPEVDYTADKPSN